MRAVVVARLRVRQGELVQEIFARVRGDAFGGAGDGDAEYVAGLRAAVAAAVEYGLQGIERGDEGLGSIPAVVQEQARRAARVGVSLETVLRRYVLGYSLLEGYVIDEAERGEEDGLGPIQRGALKEALRAQAAALDRLLAAITNAYGEEAARAGYSSPVGAGVAALPALLGNPSARRARECLLFIAEQDRRGRPDSGPSNREVATGIGVPHQPQISRLLSALAAEGLVSKRSQGAGKRNAWRLEPRGELALRMLLERRV